MVLDIASVFGTRVAETILAAVNVRPRQQTGHMIASDPIRTLQKLLQATGRPHMGPGFRRDDEPEIVNKKAREIALAGSVLF